MERGNTGEGKIGRMRKVSANVRLQRDRIYCGAKEYKSSRMMDERLNVYSGGMAGVQAGQQASRESHTNCELEEDWQTG